MTAVDAMKGGDNVLQSLWAVRDCPRWSGFVSHLSWLEDIGRPIRQGAGTRLERLGILHERTLAAHAIHVSAAERKILARRAVKVVHNPQSNCNNTVGTAALDKLVRDGVTVGLGSDGYSPRLLEEFKTALHLQKLRARDPRAGSATCCCESSTDAGWCVTGSASTWTNAA